MIDRVTSRVFGALRPVSAPARSPVTRPLSVSARDVEFVRNRRGLFVFKRAPGLEAHETADPVPPATPSVASVAIEVTIRDPSGRYLARRATIRLPRDPDPTRGADSLFTPIDVVMYPSPTSAVDFGWGVIRVSVRRRGTSSGLPNAYLRVRKSGAGGQVLARGLADARGEAMIPIAGLPVINWESDPQRPVLATDIDAVLEAFFDASQADKAPDPDAIESQVATLPSARTGVRIASGRELGATLEIPSP